MKRFVIAFAAVMLLCVTALPTFAVKPGDKPRLNFKTLDGNVVNNEVLKGRITIMEFWATWCGPCVAAMPKLKKLYEEKSPLGVAVIGVSLDKDFKKMQRFLKDKGYTWPQVGSSKEADALAKQFGVRGIPNYTILGPDGTVLWRGHPSGMDRPLQEAIKKYRHVLAQTMRNTKKSEPEELDEETLTEANAKLDEAQDAMKAGDFKQMLKRFKDIPEVALTDNDVRLRCREIVQAIQKLDTEQAKALNEARRSDKDLARAYGAVMRAARQARSKAS